MFFLPLFSLLSFSYSSHTLGVFDAVPQVPQVPLKFFFSLFSFFSLDSFYCLIVSSPFFFFCSVQYII